MKYLGFLLLLLSSCGTTRRVYTHIDPAFQDYVKRFEEASQLVHYPFIEVENLVITFGNTQIHEEFILAYCYLTDLPTIVVNQKSWEEASDLKRELILFHELGHCFLYRQHKTSLREDGFPTSVMHPEPEKCLPAYQKDKMYYLKELFGMLDFS